ncbi:MAG: hypothetical protein J6X83_02540 [Methanomicrobium sp.]|nr:hypothetical protein [Methanomicrobium sp.]
MKNLANCKPSEFLKQTSLIRKSVARWLDITEILKIRKRLPQLTPVTGDMTADEKMKVVAENKRKSDEQMQKNAMAILEAILDDHPDETLELLALLCFIDPEDVDNYSVEEYLTAFSELISNQAVINFFISLARLGNLNTLN